MNGQQDNIKQYSTEDILRYLSGKMGREENHVFERSMVDDDLLADAVEGYQLMRQSLSDEEILEKAGIVSQIRIQKHEEKTPVVPMSSFRWIGYAAAACLVVATGWWIFNLTQRGQNLPAENKISQQQDQSVVIADSTSKSSETTALTDIATTEKKESETKEIISPAPAKTKSLPPSPDEVAGLTQTPDRSMAEEKAISTDIQSLSDSTPGNARRNLAANVKINPAELLLVRAVDTADAIPFSGWIKYEDFASRQLPKPLENGTCKALLYIDPNGKVSKVQVSGKLKDNEKALAEQVLLNGPGWKSKTGLKAQAIIEWQ